jgi:CBS domain-containing protein
VIVEKAMTSDVGVCYPSDRLSDAAAIMWHRDCGAVPVIDDERRVVGILTDRDIAMALATRGQRAAEVTVGEVMSSPVSTCTTADDAREAIEVMARAQIRRLPVVDGGGRLAGILSINDVILRSKRGKSKKHVSHGEAMEALKAISRPHRDSAVDKTVETASSQEAPAEPMQAEQAERFADTERVVEIEEVTLANSQPTEPDPRADETALEAP